MAILRGLVPGEVGWVLLGHAVYLAVLGAAGLVLTARRLERLLLR